MNKIKLTLLIGMLLGGCQSKTDSGNPVVNDVSSVLKKDTLTYAYRAVYSSDIAVPSHPEYAQRVLIVWKMFERNQIDSMKPYWADTVTYNDAGGMHFRGPSESLLKVAKKDIEGLDSLRFDLVSWQSEHVNDRNEDWVRIWARERRYSKKSKPDTSQIQENWRIKDGRIDYFDQYKGKW